MSHQLTLDSVQPNEAQAEARTLADVISGYFRTVCADLGIDSPEAALLRKLQGDTRHLDITAGFLLLHLEETEGDDLLEEHSFYHRLALLGARQLVDHAMFEDLKTGWTS